MADGEDEEVEELREITDEEERDEEEREEEEEEASVRNRKSPKKLIIGLLSVLVFFVLFMVFRGGDEPVEEALTIVPTPEIVLTPEEDTTASILLPKDDVFIKGAIIEDAPAGEILIESEDGEIRTILSADEKIFPTAEEALPFFESLKEKPKPVEALPDPKKTSPETKVASVKAKGKPPQAKQEVDLNFRGKYTIQLGAFKTTRGADKLVERLRKGGYEAYILDEGGILFRVRVGTYQNRKDAKEVANQIRKSHRLDSFIVSR